MNTDKIVTLIEDEFYEKFTPLKNHLDDNASFDNCMFETFGPEMDYVREMAKKNRVVTIIECEGEEVDGEGDLNTLLIYTTGLHLVNRLGFLILDKPYEFEFEVLVD